MPRRREVVEEEAVVDDLHLQYEYGDNGEYNEYVIVEETVIIDDDEFTSLDTAIIKIVPESLDPTKRTGRVPVIDITDDLYVAFCEKVVNSEHSIPSAKQNEQLDNIYHSGDWAIARNFPDPYLGCLELLMVHLPTSKFLLRSDERTRLLTEAIVKHQNERNPVGTALQELQKAYIGLPPVGQLRNMLSLELRKVFPLAQTPHALPLPTSRILMKQKRKWKIGWKPKKQKLPVKEEAESDGTPSLTPIDDHIYDQLAEVIASGHRQPEMSFNWPMAIKSLLAKGSLVAESGVPEDGEEVLRAGWCIRERATGRIVPRKTDVQRIWTRIKERMQRTNSLAQIVAYIDAKFVGCISAEQRRAARLEDVFKGPRVVFPRVPTVIGRRPMQYVQIDIIEPPSSFPPSSLQQPFHQHPHQRQHPEHQGMLAESALLVVDLHSQYAFCKPLSEVLPSHPSLPSEPHRFLIETFSSFGPPEAFVIGVESKNWEYIQQLMEDVERHYKVSVKFNGPAKEHVCARTISAAATRRARAEGGFRWTDALPQCVLEWNQRPCRVFNEELSPFEVMFGRSPYPNCRVPPWIEERRDWEEGKEKRGRRVKEEEGEGVPPPPIPSVKERMRMVMRSRMLPAATMDEATGQKVVDPGTGMKYEIRDRVYVRNVHYQESTGPGTSGAVKREGGGGGGGKREEHRYLRGVIAEEDHAHPEFFYRVVYDGNVVGQDALPYDDWPSLAHEHHEALESAWFSPWDVAPSCLDLLYKRTTNLPPSLAAPLCSCELPCCDLQADGECARGMSDVCCARQQDGLACTAHPTVSRKNARKRKEEEMDYLRVPRPERDGNARYIFQDGALVKIPQLLPGQSMELPEQILE